MSTVRVLRRRTVASRAAAAALAAAAAARRSAPARCRACSSTLCGVACCRWPEDARVRRCRPPARGTATSRRRSCCSCTWLDRSSTRLTTPFCSKTKTSLSELPRAPPNVTPQKTGGPKTPSPSPEWRANVCEQEDFPSYFNKYRLKNFPLRYRSGLCVYRVAPKIGTSLCRFRRRLVFSCRF